MRSYLALALFGVIAACNTPTIPIPPPQPENAMFAIDGAAGTATFEYNGGTDYANVLVYVFNLTRGDSCTTCEDITQADAAGHVLSEPFGGMMDDQIDITFRRDNDLVGFCILLRPGIPSDADLCP
jgi:hypothetical protein